MVAKSKYFSGQDVLSVDLNNTEDTKIDEIQERSLVHASSRGVAFGMVLSNPGATTTIRISPGQAIDDDTHERIEIPANEDLVIAGAGDEGRFVVVEYTAVSGTPVSQPVTGASNDTRQTNSFTASIVDSGSETDAQVVLGEIDDTNGGAGPITFILTPREELTSRIADGALTDDQHDQTDGLITHRDAVGTGTPSPTNPHGLDVSDLDGFTEDASNETHQDQQHANGLLGVSTALQPSIVTGPPDSISFTDLSGTDRLWVNGKEFSALASTTLAFVDNNTVELWTVLIDDTATPAKSLRLDKTVAAVPDVTGVKIVRVSRHTPATASVVLSFVFTGSTISWNGGVAVPIVADGGQYRLYSGTAGSLDETHYVDVQVTSPLPGSSQTDNYEVFALHVEDDFYEAGRAVFNTAAAIEFLIDSREFGVTGATEVLNNTFDDERKQPRHAVMAGLVGDGVISNLAVSDGGASIDVAGGFAGLDGRLIFFPGGSVTPVVGTNYVILDADPNYSVGSRHRTGTATLRNIIGTDPRPLLTTNAARFILLAIVNVTAGPTIGVITDTRPFPYRLTTDLQPDEAGVLQGDIGVGGTLQFKSGAALDFEATSTLTNMPDDAVSTDAIQDLAVTEPKLDVDLQSVIQDPVQNRALPVSPENTLVYQVSTFESKNLAVQSFPLVINGIFVPGTEVSPSAGDSFVLNLATAAHRTVDGDTAAELADQWYHIYAEKITSGGLRWEPRVAVVGGSHDPDYFGVDPGNPDFRWIGTIRTNAFASEWVPMYKFMDGTVHIVDERTFATRADPGSDWTVFDFSFGSMPTSWTEDNLESVNLVPYTARKVLVELTVFISAGGDKNAEHFFSRGALFSGAELGGTRFALRKDTGITQQGLTFTFEIMLSNTGAIQYRRQTDSGWEIGMAVIGYKESPLC